MNCRGRWNGWGRRVFMNTGLTEIRLPEKMSDIGSAFTYSPITGIEWPEGIETIDNPDSLFLH